MTTVTDDASGIRDGTLEIAIFSIFSAIGVAGLVLVPPIGRASFWKVLLHPSCFSPDRL